MQYQDESGDVSGKNMANNGSGALRQNGNDVGAPITYDYDGFSIGGGVSSSQGTWERNHTGLIGTCRNVYRWAEV